MKIGILGAGQLAQMLAHSAYQLGLETLCLTDDSASPAGRNSPLLLGSLEEVSIFQEFTANCDVITLENENIEVGMLEQLQQYRPVYPSPNAIRVAQDRLLEKQAFTDLDIPVPDFVEVDSELRLQEAVLALGCPAVLKTRRFGYDGKGQFLIKRLEQVPEAWQAMQGQPAILEKFIEFEGEVSLIAVRSQRGDIIFYPLIKNTHKNGILRWSQFPYLDSALQQQAENYARALLEQFQYVGVLALEFFVGSFGLMANEMAPRVHNSGHLTIESTCASQFENHLRAIIDMPLVQPRVASPGLMINIIGNWPKLKISDYSPGIHIYNYGKKARQNRKLGHITVLGSDTKLPEALRQLIA
ncbi:MAG: purK [Gammaproteobacteria bacterium]|nr:purK [Gammaproteobacteria bacterium]